MQHGNNTKMIMSYIDKDDLLTEALCEFHSYKMSLKNAEMFGKDDPYVIEDKKRYESVEFRARLKDFLNLAAAIQAAITVASI
jgi:ATP-dependent RNA circularization protein (DNA/RNA ligase family)